MASTVFYILFISAEILFLFFACFYVISNLFSWLKGAPYVPTKRKDIETILKEANLQKNDNFLELGSGDGRVTHIAVQKYGMKGLGIDINPTLIWYANILSKLKKIPHAKFKTQSIFDVKYEDADVIYIFLFPALIEKLKDNLLHETKNNVMIISHGFAIPFLAEYKLKEIQASKFKTYFYKIKKSSGNNN